MDEGRQDTLVRNQKDTAFVSVSKENGERDIRNFPPSTCQAAEMADTSPFASGGAAVDHEKWGATSDLRAVLPPMPQHIS